jgi:hypothetical protein
MYVIGSGLFIYRLYKICENANKKRCQSFFLDYKYNDRNDPNRFISPDHYNFAKNGIPSVFYSLVYTLDYHKATDEVDKIEFDVSKKERTSI